MEIAFASCDDSAGVQIWTKSGRNIRQLTGIKSIFRCLSFNPDGSRLASGGEDGWFIWNTESGAIEVEPEETRRFNVNSIKFSSDGLLIGVSSASRKVVELHIAATGEFLGAISCENNATSVSFNYLNEYIAISLDSGDIAVWDCNVYRLITQFVAHIHGANCLEFHPSRNQLLSGGMDDCVILWDIPSGAELLRCMGHIDCITSLGFSADGCLFVSCSPEEAILWDTHSGVQQRDFDARECIFTSVCFSSDGRQLITAGFNGLIRVWSIDSGKVVKSIRLDDSVRCVCATKPCGGSYI